MPLSLNLSELQINPWEHTPLTNDRSHDIRVPSTEVNDHDDQRKEEA
jgi:hypothetical protein